MRYNPPDVAAMYVLDSAGCFCWQWRTLEDSRSKPRSTLCEAVGHGGYRMHVRCCREGYIRKQRWAHRHWSTSTGVSW